MGQGHSTFLPVLGHEVGPEKTRTRTIRASSLGCPVCRRGSGVQALFLFGLPRVVSPALYRFDSFPNIGVVNRKVRIDERFSYFAYNRISFSEELAAFLGRKFLLFQNIHQ